MVARTRVDTASLGRSVLRALTFGAALAVRAQLQAANPDARTGASSTNFNDALNWSLGTPANDLTTHVGAFTGTPTAKLPALNANRNLAGLVFSSASGGWTLGTAAAAFVLTNGASGVTSAGQTSGTNLISASLALGANQTWQAGLGGNLLFTGSLLANTNSPRSVNPNLAIPALTINGGANQGNVILSPGAGESVVIIGSNTTSLLNLKAGGWLVLGGEGTNAPLTASTNYLQNTSTSGFGTWGFNSPAALLVNSGTWFTGDLGRNGSDNFTGSLVVRGGVLSFGGARYLSAGSITVSGGVLRVASTNSTLVNGGRFALGSSGSSGNASLTISGGLVDLAQANSGNSLGSALSSQLRQTGGIFRNGLTLGGGSNGGTSSSFSLGASGTVAGNLSAVTLSGGSFLCAGTLQSGGSSGAGNLNNFNFSGGVFSVGSYSAAGLGYASATGLAGGPPHANPVANSVGLGTLYNHGGTLAPGGTNLAGKTTITGHFVVNSPTAALAVDLGGSAPATAFQHPVGYYDTVAVTGNVVLDGSLSVSLVNGFVPAHTDTFTMLTAANVSGAFTNAASGSRFVTAGGEGSFLVAIRAGSVTLSGYLPTGSPPTLLDLIAQLQVLVDGLPATNPPQQWKNAVLSLGLEQASNAFLVGYVTDASNRLTDVQGAISTDADVMAATSPGATNIGSLVLPLTTNGNPYLDVMYAGLATTLAAADTDWGKNTTTNQIVNADARSVAEDMEAYLFQFVNPVSTNRGDAEVLTRFLRRAHAYADTVDVHDSRYAAGASIYDDFAIAPCSGALREFARLYPGLLLPSQQALWDRAMTKASAKMWTKAGPAVGNYANIDLLEAYQFLNFGLYLTNQTYLNKSKFLLDARTHDAYADGAWAYIWTQNESRGYHSVDTDYIGRYFLVSGYALCTNLLQHAAWYGPVSNGRGGEFWTAPSWKQLWNSASPDTGGEQAIAFSGNPYLRWMQDTYLLPGAVADPANWSSRRWDATFYRADITPKPLPDHYTLLDRNILGPRAWHGRFHYAAPGRNPADTEPGEATLMGAGIQETNATLWNAIVLGVYPRVRQSLSTNQPGTDSGRFDWAWLTARLTNDFTVGGDFSALSATYRMHKYGSSTKGTEYNWRGKQEWLGLPDRLIGWLSVSPDTNSATAYEVDGVVRLGTGGTVNSAPKTIQNLGGNTNFAYGDLQILIHGNTFGSLSTPVVPFRLASYPATEITMQDAPSLPFHGTNLLTYSTNQEYHFVVEIRPTSTTSAATVSRQVDGNGLRTLTASVPNAKYLLLHNPGPLPRSYSNTVACAYAYAACFTGWQSQPPQMNPVPIQAGQASLVVTVPARGQLVFVNTSDASLLQLGWPSGTEFFSHPDRVPVMTRLALAGANLVIAGTNGTAGAAYQVLSATNLSLPLAEWTSLATNQFGPGGRFDFTNRVDPGKAAEFLQLRLP